jgi:hypothetical protein
MCGATAGQSIRAPRKQQRQNVTQIVSTIGKQGEGMGEKARNYFNSHKNPI